MREPVPWGGTYPKGIWSSFISVAVLRYPDKKATQGGRAYFSLQLQLESIIAWKSGQELQTAGHITSKVKSREKWVHACSFAQFPHSHRLRTPPGNNAAQSGPSLPISVNFIKTTHHRHAQRPTKYGQSLIETLSLLKGCCIVSSWQLKLTITVSLQRSHTAHFQSISIFQNLFVMVTQW